MKSLLLCLSLIFTVSCSSVSKLTNPSEKEINLEAGKAYEEVKKKSKISKHKKWNEMLDRVAPRIAKASGVNFKWEWILIESNEVNAWCMPGGKMAVYTGIMPVLKNEAALAAVLGHEVAHATKRHGKERYARAIKGNLTGLAIGVGAAVAGQLYCKTEQCKQLAGLSGAAAGLALTFFDRKFSRGDETEADQYGQEYMAKAGYDPAEAIQLWVRMGQASGGKAPPELLSTHPSSENRQRELKGWLPKTKKMYSKAKVKYGLGEKI